MRTTTVGGPASGAALAALLVLASSSRANAQLDPLLSIKTTRPNVSRFGSSPKRSRFERSHSAGFSRQSRNTSVRMATVSSELPEKMS